MIMRICSLFLITVLLCALTATTALGARSAKETSKIDERLLRSQVYSFPEIELKRMTRPGKAVEPPQRALGAFAPSASPGFTIGDTWYDYQRNGSMRRMITSGTHSGDIDTFLVQFSWMRLPNEDISQSRSYRYDIFNAATGIFGQEVSLQPAEEFAGYCGISRTPRNQAVVGGHNNLLPPNDPYQVHLYYDYGAGTSFFNTNSRVPDSVGSYADSEAPRDGYIWPAFEYVEDDTGMGYTHVIAQNPETGGVAYMRKVGTGAAGQWDYPPIVLDTLQTVSQDLDATNDGKLALVWVSNVPCNPACDTCSGGPCIRHPQWDNDVYVEISTDYGENFLPRLNATKNIDGVAGYRPYSDLSALFAGDGLLHIAYNARVWPSDARQGGDAGSLRNRIFHLTVNPITNLAGPITTVHNSEWDQPNCTGGAFMMQSSKMTISECDGKLYVLFVQFNDVPNGVDNDCATTNSRGYPSGAANGDLYIAISDNWGITWDAARNVTNSRTTGCDSTGGANGPCDSDNWPSMTRFGSDYLGIFPPDAIILNSVLGDDPPSHAGYYLDAQYINDKSAGGVVQSEGWWQKNDVKWIRIPCVDPVRAADLYTTPPDIDYPSWSAPGVQLDTPFVVENGGNDTLYYSISVAGGAWLSLTPTSGTIAAGLANKDTLTLSLNVGGTQGSPGTITHLTGQLIVDWYGFTNPPPSVTDTIPIEHWVTDTLYKPFWDDIETSCTKLTVSTHGNFGRAGLGGVNLDYSGDPGECDTNENVYIYDGSPVICYNSGGETDCYWSVFSTSITDTNALRPFGGHVPTTDMGEYEVFQSGRFITADSLVALEKIWYAPTSTSDTCSFVIECLKIYLNDTLKVPPTGIRIAEAMDWDIPTDDGSNNGSGYDDTGQILYQLGCEEDDNIGCVPADTRFGGIKFLLGKRNQMVYTRDEFGGYTHDNATHVYPSDGLHEDTVYEYTSEGTIRISDSTCSDLHMVMTFDTLQTLLPTDTFMFYVLIASHMTGTLQSFREEIEAGEAWFCAHIGGPLCGCCNGDGMRGNADGVTGAGGEVDVADLTYTVAYLFLGGPAPPCLDEGNTDGITGAGGPVDVADLTYLVAYLFLGGPAPAPC